MLDKYFKNLDGTVALPRKGRAAFIVFEGLDGSGQSTQAELLKEFLKEKGCQVILTKEPTSDSEPGREAKKMLNKKINSSPRKIQELITKDRKEHLEKTITPALKEGKIVISDRYFFSTLAYGAADGIGSDWLFEINKLFLYPDIIFLFKVRPEVCMERIIKRGRQISVFEEEKKLASIWDVYKTFPEKFSNFHLIDGEKDIRGVSEQIKALISKNLL